MKKNALDLIGKTPIIKLSKIKSNKMADIFIKLEGSNVGGSIKDRIVVSMIEFAEKTGKLKSGSTIIEPTSGNTGIALALLGAIKGYKVKIVMPDNMSIERRKIIKEYGAEIVLTDGTKGMTGAIKKAKEILDANILHFMPNQFENIANANAHYLTTGVEIINEVSDIDMFVAGVGTGGTISGVGKRLKEANPSVKIIAVEPANSSVLSGNKAGSHKIQGIGAGFIPKVYDPTVVDRVVKVEESEVFDMKEKLAKEEGLLLGISSAANIYVSLCLAKNLGSGGKIVTIAPDNGEKYLFE